MRPAVPSFDLVGFAAEEFHRRADHQRKGLALRRLTDEQANAQLRPWAAMALRLGAALAPRNPGASWHWADGTPPYWHHVYPDDMPIPAMQRDMATEAARAARLAVQRHRERPEDHALETRAFGLIRLACHFAPLAGLPIPQPFAEAEDESIAA